MRRARLRLALIGSLWLWALPLRAQERTEDAQALFEHGRSEFVAGNFRPALEAFQRVFELTGNHAVLFNIAVAWQRLGEPGEAARTLRRYLVAEPGAANRADIEQQIQQLEAQDQAIHPGASSGPPGSGSPAPQSAAPASSAPPPPPEEHRSFLATVGPAAAAGVGVVSLIVSLATFVARNGALGQLQPMCSVNGNQWTCDPGATAMGDWNNAVTLNTTSAVMLAFGLVGIGAGVGWWFLGAPSSHDDRAPRAGVVPTGNGMMLTLGWSR